MKPSSPLRRERESPTRRRLIAAARWLGTAGCVALLLYIIDIDALRMHLSDASPGWLVVGLALSLPLYLLLAWRWWFIARRIGAPLRFRNALADYYLSTLLNQTMPIGVAGDAVRAVRHARRLSRAEQEAEQRAGEGAPLALAVRALLLERLAGAAALAVVVLVAAASLVGSRPHIAGLAALVVLVAVAVAGFAAVLTRRRAGEGMLARFARAGRRSLVGGGALGYHAVVSTGIVALLVVLFYCAGQAARVGVAWLPVVQLAPIVLASLWLPLSFAGWGAREAVTAALFAAMGLDMTAGVALSVMFGLLNLAAAAPGLVVLLWPARRESG